jgi:hypothetical protein
MSMSVSDLQALPEDSPSLLHVVGGAPRRVLPHLRRQDHPQHPLRSTRTCRTG